MQTPQRFAIVTMGSGDYLGSTVRDLAFANALHRRGFKVVVYWMMEINRDLADPGIEHRMLCYGTRYHFRYPSEPLDRLLGPALFLLPKKMRVRIVQARSGYVDRLLSNLVHALYAGPGADRALGRRLRTMVDQDGVTHMMMSFATLGPLALEAKKAGERPFDYFLTFQGDEQFAAHAARLGILAPFCRRLNEALAQSCCPGIVVSRDYVTRIVDEMQVDPARLQVIYNGIDMPDNTAPEFSVLQSVFPDLSKDLPVVTFLGRQDTEKGIDLLVYAARLLARRGVRLQLVICGSTAKGGGYRKVIDELGEHLGLRIHHTGSVSPEVRAALYAHSHCVVYPSINREPFGLVAAEAMSYGTPVLVPDYGGIGEVIRFGQRAGGLTFHTWDSGDLARQLARMLQEEAMYRKLRADTREVAARFSVETMTSQILEHIGVAHGVTGTGVAPSQPANPAESGLGAER
jgi:glycosyltransferase involved in cell wall biosynthesis